MSQSLPMNAEGSILIVDDEMHILETSKLALRTAGIGPVLTCNDSREVMGIIQDNTISLVILDIMMPFVSGKELLEKIHNEHPHIPVIMMSGVNELNTVVDCMKLGAVNYLDKPVENLRLVTSVRRALEYREVQQEVHILKDHLLKSDLRNPDVFSSIITDDDGMYSIFRYIESIAITLRAVLITGDTGTGKELMAKAIHDLSSCAGEYVTVNVAGLDDTLFSDALFGHKKGAFTGADSNRKGLLEQAQGGTIFLDEIGDLSMSSQVKLLRLLQEREYYQLGSDVKKRTDARFIVATSSDIKSKIEKDEFRKDLYYRLQAHHFHIPPLCERKGDVKILIDHFIEESSKSLQKNIEQVDDEVYHALSQYPFPGNVRELEAMIFNAMSTVQGEVLDIELFKRDLEEAPARSTPIVSKEVDIAEKQAKGIHFSEPYPTIDECVDQLVNLVLEKNNHNQTATAKELGITRQGLISRLKRRKQLEGSK